MTSTTRQLTQLGQSLWYDYIRRDLYQGPELRRLIQEDDLRGMTSNPTIFEKAIAQTTLYDGTILRIGKQDSDPHRIFEALAVEDVGEAADVFRTVFDATGGNDGFVSIEVGPQLAYDTQASIGEAHRLWSRCARPNIMVKIPGTEPGIPAIRRCLEDGLNINITLLFSVERYRAVMEAYLSALETRAQLGKPINHIRSVASFFVSRVDTNADRKLDAIARDSARSEGDRAKARALRGKLAIANARVAYRAFEEVFGSARFAALKAKGAALQRPLWASTSTKDPAYPDLYYVESLVAPHTVDTVPVETFAAIKDHGKAAVHIRDDFEGAQATFRGLSELGLDEKQISRELEEEGVRKFVESFDQVLAAIRAKQQAMLSKG
jgi:transaldolase